MTYQIEEYDGTGTRHICTDYATTRGRHGFIATITECGQHVTKRFTRRGPWQYRTRRQYLRQPTCKSCLRIARAEAKRNPPAATPAEAAV